MMPPCTSLRRRVVGRWLALVAMSAVAAATAAAAGVGIINELELVVPAAWQETESMTLNGLSIFYRQFSSSETAGVTAEALARKAGLFDSAVAFNGKFVLSGLRGDSHWVAEIDADAHGSRGTVSVLRQGVGANPPQPSARAQALASHDWLPPDATPVFDQTVRGGEHHYVQRVYRLAQPAAQASRIVRARLAGRGWSPVPAGTGSLSGLVETWHRGATRMVLAFTPESSGSALFIHYRK